MAQKARKPRSKKPDSSPAAVLKREQRRQKMAENKQKHTSKMLAAVKQAGLPEPVQELTFSPPRKWRFDFAWEQAKLAVEVNGGGGKGRHFTVMGATKDAEKANAAVVNGWAVLVFTVVSIKDTDYVARTLRAAYDQQLSA
jgi:very-short-patch-repair endonuclease